MSNTVAGWPKVVLQIEGAATFALAIAAYAQWGGGWWLFAALILAPDIAMIGYLAGSRTGAALYNAAHTYTLPLTLLGLGFAVGSPSPQSVALIWIAHIGMDRAVGYGLKYASSFGDTHLSRKQVAA